MYTSDPAPYSYGPWTRSAIRPKREIRFERRCECVGGFRYRPSSMQLLEAKRRVHVFRQLFNSFPHTEVKVRIAFTRLLCLHGQMSNKVKWLITSDLEVQQCNAIQCMRPLTCHVCSRPLSSPVLRSQTEGINVHFIQYSLSFIY